MADRTADERKRTRRALVRALTASGTLGLLAPPATRAAPPSTAQTGKPTASRRGRSPRWSSSFLAPDPVENFLQTMRIQRSLEPEADILHWYHFIMVAVPVGMSPRPVVRWEGIEFSRHQRLDRNRFRLHGHNLSYPRDLKGGAFVDEVLNPVTKQKVAVPPMALAGDPGWCARRRESWPATFLEMGYEATPAAAFDDPSQSWLPSEFSGAYVFPWPEWMRMGDAPGHMFAAWSGYKLRSVDELADEFRRRAERDNPALLRVDRAPFARPLP